MPTFFSKQKFFGWGAGFSNPEQFKFGDFNGDGNLDLFVARIGSDQGTTAEPQKVFIGDGKGNFSDETSSLFKSGVPYANYAARTVVTDLNGDGASDIFIVDSGIDKPPFSGGQNKLFLSSSNRQLIDSTNSLPQSLHMNHGSSVADMNQDGRQDILVNALMSSGNDLQIQDAAGRFISSPSLMPNLTDTTAHYSRVFTNTWSALIDLNNDKYPDMILGKWDNDSSPKFNLVYLNKSGSYANSASINLPTSGVNLEIVLDIKPIDLNGDDLPDLALSITNGNGGDSKLPYYQTAYVQLLVNAGNGQFRDETSSRLPQDTTIKTYQTWYKSIEVVDINHDGFSDMILEDFALGSKLMLSDGKGKFNEISLVEGNAGYQRSVVGDINKDGMSDLILSNTNTGFDVYENAMPNGRIYKANFGGETLLGSNQSDRFISSNGNDKFIGNGGVDVVKMRGNKANYTITSNGSTTVSDLTKADGTDTIVNISRLEFADKTIALDIDGNAGQAYRIYKAAFNRTPDNGGLKYWIGMMDGGKKLSEVASGFIASNEFKALYGANPSNDQFVAKLYNNVLGRAPDAGGFNYWVGLLNNKQIDMTSTLVNFSESTENQAGVIGVIQNGIELI